MSTKPHTSAKHVTREQLRRMNVTELIVEVTPGAGHLCRFRDNVQMMRREAISVESGAVVAHVAAGVLLSADDRMREELGPIAAAPWGALENRAP